MQKKSVVVSMALVLCLGLAPFGFAQLENPLSPSHRTLGYFNSDTGLFEPLHPGLQDPELLTATPTTGTLVFNFTITLKSTIPAHGIVLCNASGDVIETNFSAAEAGLGIAHLVSGNTYSCSVSMPYSWLLNTPSTDKIILAYKAQIFIGLQVTATNGTGTSVTGGASRASSQTTASIPVPANGATTTENVSVTL
jgi:hypothetical protein